MSERTPVTTAAELATLDSAEMVEGYVDGFKGEPEPGDNRSKAYWHGWQNGRDDRELRSRWEAIELIRDRKRHGELGGLP